MNQEVAIGLLEVLDCAVTVTGNGREALDAAIERRFDLILMDCQMPVMDGLEATRAIRSGRPDEKNLPIIALTANDIEEARADCLAAGMDDLLGKPFTLDELTSLLQRWCPATERTLSSEPVGASANEVSSLDLAPIETLRALDPDGERDLVRRTITKFLGYSDELIARLGEAAGEGNTAEIARIAHSLKSSSANLGAVDLSRQCREIETQIGNTASSEDLEERLAALKAAHEDAKQSLRALIGGE